MPVRKSLGELIAEVPTLVTNLVRAEIDSFKNEMGEKGKALGLGAGLLAAAGFFAVFMFGWLLIGGYLALTLVLPEWASALIVAGVLLIIAGILAAVGIPKLKQVKSLAPEETIESVKRDVKVVQGLGAESRGPLTAPPSYREGEM